MMSVYFRSFVFTCGVVNMPPVHSTLRETLLEWDDEDVAILAVFAFVFCTYNYTLSTRHVFLKYLTFSSVQNTCVFGNTNICDVIFLESRIDSTKIEKDACVIILFDGSIATCSDHMYTTCSDRSAFVFYVYAYV